MSSLDDDRDTIRTAASDAKSWLGSDATASAMAAGLLIREAVRCYRESGLADANVERAARQVIMVALAEKGER